MKRKEAITLLQTIIEDEPVTISAQDYKEALQVAIRAMEAFESIDFNIYALGKLMEEYKNEAD